MDFIKQAEKWEQKWAWFCPDKFQNAFDDYMRAGNEFKNIHSDPAAAIDAYKRAEALLPKLEYSNDHQRQKIYKCIAEAYCKKGDISLAEEYYLDSAKFVISNKEVGRIFNDCGIMYLGHDYLKASEYFRRSAENGYPRNYLNSALALARHHKTYNDDVIELFRLALKANSMVMSYDTNVKLYALLSRDTITIESVYNEFPGNNPLINDLRNCYDRKTFNQAMSRHNIELSSENDSWKNVMLLRIRDGFPQNSDSDDIC